jgi:hypothetical protein
MQIDLGKKPFHKFTKSALIDMIEDAIMVEKDKSLPMHKRGQKDKVEKDDATEAADAEREELADLAEEMHGKPAPVEMDEEDMGDEAMDKIESTVKKVNTKKKNV